MDYQISDELPSAEEYCGLRQASGLSARTIDAAQLALPRALYTVTIRKDGNLVGMGRVVGDLGCHVQIADIAVHPDHQGKGLSHQIMHHIMQFIEKAVPTCAFVNLFADVDFLYQRYGFTDKLAAKGMYLEHR